MTGNIRVKKRNNRLEPYNVEKIHKVVLWATEGINNVSASDLEMNAQLSLYDKITTEDIHQILIKSAVNLISEETPNYQYVAARLINQDVRKKVWGGETPPRLLDLVKMNIKKDVYDPYILKKYSNDEINKLGNYIKHKRDELFTYSGLQQMVDKYLVKNRNTGEIYESPQFAYMLISMILFSEYGEDRLDYVKEAYDLFSTFKISLATPIMAGVRTRTRAFSSCYLIDVDDSLDSIFSSIESVAKLTARRGGIGINMGRIRPINSPIRGGEVIHTGVIPYLKVFESAVKSTSQNGLRGGGGTVSIPWWHAEIEDIVVLKNNAGTDDNRVRKLDYTVQFDKVFYERLVKNEEITLFSPAECPELYEAFGHPEFEKIYKECEEKTNLQFSRKISTRKLAELIARERLETGRIYIANIDNINSGSSWDCDVKMSNLCVEVVTPTVPTKSITDEDAEIGVCTLSAVNLLEIKNDEDLERTCDIIVRLLNAIIDFQDYYIHPCKNFAINRRSLGIGITNLAALFAKNKCSYNDQEALELVDEWMEKIQYYSLKSSCAMAKVHGPCPKFEDTKYSKGLLPIDWANKNAKALTKRKYTMDWEGLRKEIKEHGLYNSTLTAIMPCESSSVIQNSTNGIEPVRRLLTNKKAKNGTLKQLVPNYHKYKNYYDLAFDFMTNDGLIKVSAVIQKWVDMAMSTNVYYNYAHYEDGKIPLSILVKDILTSYKYGLKTLYYANSPDSDVDATSTAGCEGGGCSL